VDLYNTIVQLTSNALSYTPFTRSSKHRADSSSWHIAASRASSSSQLDRVNGVLVWVFMNAGIKRIGYIGGYAESSAIASSSLRLQILAAAALSKASEAWATSRLGWWWRRWSLQRLLCRQMFSQPTTTFGWPRPNGLPPTARQSSKKDRFWPAVPQHLPANCQHLRLFSRTFAVCQMWPKSLRLDRTMIIKLKKISYARCSQAAYRPCVQVLLKPTFTSRSQKMHIRTFRDGFRHMKRKGRCIGGLRRIKSYIRTFNL